MNIRTIIYPLLGLVLLGAAPHAAAQSEGSVEPVYSERLDEYRTRSEVRETRQENRNALDSIQAREERNEYEPAPFFNGGLRSTNFHQGGFWPGYSYPATRSYFPNTYYRRGYSGFTRR